MKINKTIFLILLTFSLAGCEPQSLGNSLSGYKEIQGAKIQPQKAVELASPFLDKTFELRQKDSELARGKDREPIIYVTLKNDEYYIVKENYPAISVYFYLKHAVKVNIKTGKVTPPE
ncbi:MAG: hypothetical protein AAB332_00935 [Planctomycetota bacterium]